MEGKEGGKSRELQRAKRALLLPPSFPGSLNSRTRRRRRRRPALGCSHGSGSEEEAASGTEALSAFLRPYSRWVLMGSLWFCLETPFECERGAGRGRQTQTDTDRPPSPGFVCSQVTAAPANGRLCWGWLETHVTRRHRKVVKDAMKQGCSS